MHTHSFSNPHTVTGSNTHNNGAPGGDGQTGDAGEGTSGTDRHNIVETPHPNSNYPLPWERASMFKDAEVLWSSFVDNPSADDLAVAFMSAGYYQCHSGCDDSIDDKGTRLQQLLNNAPASFEGALLRFSNAENQEKTYHYICSRNNNFTNRSQKGRITVKPERTT